MGIDMDGRLFYCNLFHLVRLVLRRGKYLRQFISRIVDWVSTPYSIYLILKDPFISRSVKIRAAVGLCIIFAYIISPIDIIPDFIPFAGWLDDLIIVPLGFALLRIFTPGLNIVEKRDKAQRSVKQILLLTIITFLVVILVGLTCLSLLIYIIVRLIAG
jgi:uncharacterized membrane protein YkvA (DUF1232 family)